MIELDGATLAIPEIIRVTAGETVAVTASALRAVAAQYDVVQRFDGPVYGRTTGLGANRRFPGASPVAPSSNGPDDAARAMLASHASASGSWRSRERVRAMVVVRLNQLAGATAGVHPRVVGGLVDRLNSDTLPPVRDGGSIGTGDLAALAAVALHLGADPATPQQHPVHLSLAEALPFLSSNAATIGDAALAVHRWQRSADAALVVAAATFHAVAGNGEAFSAAVEDITPFPGARRVCRTMRSLTVGARPASRIQDPFGLRTLPQVHGPLLDALDRAADIVVTSANAGAENPLYRADGVVHHGGFHMAYLGQALDAVRSAAAQAAQLSLARLSMVCRCEVTGLPPFLADGQPGSSGIMMLEYVSAAALGEMRALTAPTGVQTAALSDGWEEDASFAALSARQVAQVADSFVSVVAAELVAAVRAVRMRHLEPTALLHLLDQCRDMSAELADRDLSTDLQQAARIVSFL